MMTHLSKLPPMIMLLLSMRSTSAFGITKLGSSISRSASPSASASASAQSTTVTPLRRLPTPFFTSVDRHQHGVMQSLSSPPSPSALHLAKEMDTAPKDDEEDKYGMMHPHSASPLKSLRSPPPPSPPTKTPRAWIQQRLELKSFEISRLNRRLESRNYSLRELSIKDQLEPALLWLQLKLLCDRDTLKEAIMQEPEFLFKPLDRQILPTLALMKERIDVSHFANVKEQVLNNEELVDMVSTIFDTNLKQEVEDASGGGAAAWDDVAAPSDDIPSIPPPVPKQDSSAAPHLAKKMDTDDMPDEDEEEDDDDTYDSDDDMENQETEDDTNDGDDDDIDDLLCLTSESPPPSPLPSPRSPPSSPSPPTPSPRIWIQQRLGLKDFEVRRLNRRLQTRNHPLENLSVKDQLEPTLLWLQLKLLCNRETLKDALLQEPEILFEPLDRKILPTVLWVKERIGVSDFTNLKERVLNDEHMMGMVSEMFDTNWRQEREQEREDASVSGVVAPSSIPPPVPKQDSPAAPHLAKKIDTDDMPDEDEEEDDDTYYSDDDMENEETEDNTNDNDDLPRLTSVSPLPSPRSPTPSSQTPSPPTSSLSPRIWIQQRLGLKDFEVRRLNRRLQTRNHQLENLSVKDQLEPALLWLQLKLLCNRETLKDALLQEPEILFEPLDRKILPTVLWVKERIGVSDFANLKERVLNDEHMMGMVSEMFDTNWRQEREQEREDASVSGMGSAIFDASRKQEREDVSGGGVVVLVNGVAPSKVVRIIPPPVPKRNLPDRVQFPVSEYLRLRLNLSDKKLANILRKAQDMPDWDATVVEAHLTFLQDRLVITVEELSTAIEAYPTVMVMGVEDKLAPLLDYLQSRLSLNTKELTKIILQVPKLVGYEPQEDLEPKIEYLENHPLLDEDDALRNIIKQSPDLLILSQKELEAVRFDFSRD